MDENRKILEKVGENEDGKVTIQLCDFAYFKKLRANTSDIKIEDDHGPMPLTLNFIKEIACGGSLQSWIDSTMTIENIDDYINYKTIKEDTKKYQPVAMDLVMSAYYLLASNKGVTDGRSFETSMEEIASLAQMIQFFIHLKFLETIILSHAKESDKPINLDGLNGRAFQLPMSGFVGPLVLVRNLLVVYKKHFGNTFMSDEEIAMFAQDEDYTFNES